MGTLCLYVDLSVLLSMFWPLSLGQQRYKASGIYIYALSCFVKIIHDTRMDGRMKEKEINYSCMK